MADPLVLARTADGRDLALLPALANRHGLVTGATGTGKTVTLQVLAERFSAIGVPSVLADVKGDLAGLAEAGSATPKLTRRLESLKLPAPAWTASPVTFWDVFGRSGHPIRATISDMGPLVLGRLLGLNETQDGVLAIVFKIADDNGLLLLDLRDLRAMLQYVGDNARQFTTGYGNISSASIGTIQRALLAVDQQGGSQFFGEPMLDIHDFIRTDANGHGMVNVIAADALMQAPKVYASFLLWMLSELFEQLPEVGDPEQPKLVFFFDEAHLLFEDAPSALVDKIEQVVRLIRSKGVGVYFVTQNPLDVPEKVLAQLGNRVQHALRAFTPRDQRAVRAAAETLRANPALDTTKTITELAVGEALVSCLDAKGTPGVVERAWILPPASRIGTITDAERRAVIDGSSLKGRYDQAVDRESAYETLTARTTARTQAPGAADQGARPNAGPAAPAAAAGGALGELVFGTTGPRGGHHPGLLESALKSTARSIGSGFGRQIVRGVLGSLFGGRR
ncbi:MAG TPA: helicase HerA-like domain-containing protein [Vicinamibacterales bacterium]|mgnify:CR=1 FL=1|jgi:DNA helicase HerA-like ATPase|nr:helicase HerA-like domain-containing protein [Vicinamibacterales bacterium]